MNNNELDAIFDEDPNSQGTANDESPDTQGNADSSNVEPVKLGRLATTAILIVGVVIVIIILLTIKSCSLERVGSNTNSSVQRENASFIEPENRVEYSSSEGMISFENVVDSSTIFYDSESFLEEVESTSSEKSKSEKISNAEAPSIASTVEGSNNNDDLFEVAEPSLSSELQSKGIVIAKHSYLYKGSYVYGISISMLIGETSETVQYFCPKKTYDALNSMDTVNIVYQLDSSGNISVMTISK